MQAQRYGHKARFNETELTVLCNQFPNAKEWIKGNAKQYGPVYTINVDAAHLAQKDAISTELFDCLYRRAYSESPEFINIERFSSYWNQLKLLLSLPKSEVQTVLEVGPGMGVFSKLCTLFDYKLTTLDVVKDTGPNI